MKITTEDLWFDTAEVPPYSGIITEKFGDLGKVLEWCRLNCNGKFRWLSVDLPNYDNNKNGTYEFFFTDKNDHLLFMLHWA